VKNTKRTTYLSRVESDYFSRNWYCRSVTLFCNLLFTGQWMRKAQIVRCLVVEISEGGATVRIGRSQVPDHLYLVIGSFDVLIGSIVVQRDTGHLQLCFLKQLKPDFVNRLSRMTSPFATLESLGRRPILAGEDTQPTLRAVPPAPVEAREGRIGQTTKYPKRQ
tara:strand:- start:4 stop:495 length:492 start_codon:yes stop_codon:yes gene_type:complete